jgi:hypothetical protein
MLEVSSFLCGKNLCNIFADLIVKKINEVSPDAKTQITVINVRNFFIVKGVSTSENVINLSDILSDLFQKYNSELINKVRVIDTILYNKKFNLNLNLNYTENKYQSKLHKEIFEKCNELQKDGYYITVKLNNGILFYDFEHEKDFDPNIIKEKFSNYTCLKDDFSQDTYCSDFMYGLSNDGIKYFYTLVKKISFNLFTRGFSKVLNLSLSSELKLDEINSENINLTLSGKNIIENSKLESLILDNFNFNLSDLEKEFDLQNIDVLSYISENKEPIWENYSGTSDLILL